MRLASLLCGSIAAALLLPAVALADNDGPWMVRARAIGVLPDESATVVPIGGDTEIDDTLVPELDFTYFFAKHWAAELILATTPHDVSHTPTGLDLGSVWLLPPTLTVQYHIAPDSPSFRPYVGAGVNYTIFYNVDEPTGLSIDYENSFGFALQAGVDFPIGDGWMINVDVKKVFLSTDVTIAPLGVTADVDIDPWIVGLGVGYRY
ncbi:MAG: OmpW family outer membrane protein [Alphaproteobacteria bacterium]|nr:OmpW family outer membrane protein [Alphaproteobacteria bacterium]